MTSNVAQHRTTCAVLLLASQLAWSTAFAQEEDGGWLEGLSDWLQPSSGTRAPDAQAPMPAAVDRAVRDLVAEVVVVREAVGVQDIPPEPEPQEGRRPIHAYGKALEVLSKVRGIQRRFGVPAAAPGRLPPEPPDWPAVTAQVRYVMDELRKIKEPRGIDGEIEPATAASGGNPAEAYRRLAYASALLDGLLGRTLTTDDVHRNCTGALDELVLVGAALGISLDLEVPPVDQVMGPKDVARRVVLAISRIIELQAGLGMDASAMPSLTMVRVTPTEVFDVCGTLLAETVRIKMHLGIDAVRPDRPDPNGSTFTDTFALTLVVTGALDAMSAAIES